MMETKKIYVVRSMYLPNSAVHNRMMGHLTAFSQLGIEVEAAFMSPNSQRDKINQHIPGVSFHYCWEKSHIKNRYLKALYSYWLAWRYVKNLPKGSHVLILGSDNFLPIFLKRKDLRIYHETTEHPGLARSGRGLKRYVNVCKKLDHLFVISQPLRQFFIDNGVQEDKVTIVNMTVDPSRFVGLTKDNTVERYIAYCGTATNNKDGVDELLKAFSLTHQKHPDVKLYIIGATPDKEDRSGNMRLIESLGIKDAVVFTGVVDASLMPQLLKNASVLALDRPDSLQAQNGFPTKLGEYLLTGNPVVVTKVGDIPLFLRDGVSALLCEERNAKVFSSKMNWALENPEAVAKIGEQGCQVALKSFDCVKEGNKLLSAIF